MVGEIYPRGASHDTKAYFYVVGVNGANMKMNTSIETRVSMGYVPAGVG